MATFSMEAACRAILRRRLPSVRGMTEVGERQYHRYPSTACLHRIRGPRTQQLLVFTNVRHQSTVTAAASQIPVVLEAHLPASSPLLPTPDAILPPPVLDNAPTVTEILAQGEQTLSELGLGGYSPVGLIQSFLELVHINLGVPWWGAIVTGTVIARILIFPLIVKGQREAAKLNNHMPQISALSNQMNEAKRSGNKFEFAKAYTDFSAYQKKHDVNPLRGFLVPLIQTPVFISFFVGLRQMTSLPVPSLQTGGLWWFTDLTIADPYYILPLVVTSSMFAVLELGAESGINNPNLQMMKTVLRIMPLVLLPFIINFPTAVVTYWVTSNIFSVAQVAFLRIPSVRKKLKIPEQIKHSPSVLPKQEGFIKSLKKGWQNAQLAQQLEERERKMKNHLDIAAKDRFTKKGDTYILIAQDPPFTAEDGHSPPPPPSAQNDSFTCPEHTPIEDHCDRPMLKILCSNLEKHLYPKEKLKLNPGKTHLGKLPTSLPNHELIISAMLIWHETLPDDGGLRIREKKDPYPK